MEVPVVDKAAIDKFRAEQFKAWQTPRPGGGMTEWDMQHKYGTSISTYASAHSGDSPVKNWGGIGVIDVPNRERPAPGCIRGSGRKGPRLLALPGSLQSSIERGYRRIQVCRRRPSSGIRNCRRLRRKLRQRPIPNRSIWSTIFVTAPVSTLFPPAPL